MTPQPSQIAHYRITSKLGEGGMGAVYRATDTKLNRDVAIKVIPETFAADPDRLARFTREAQVLASLNHPHIAAIYGVEDRALVLELVEGSELKGPLTPDEALPLIHQLADALEYAHERGIVHRDLKPANLKLTPQGNLKVLDFGLAKALSSDPSASSADTANSPTLTMSATMAGAIMGTAAYMSPEQARGQFVDKRADIWSFGVVVYELLTGKPLFDGPTVSDILAAVLTREPDLSAVPPRFHKLLRLCLTRDPRQRLRDISAVRLLLEEPPLPSAPAARSKAPWIAATVFALAALALAAALYRRPAAEPPNLRFSILPPPKSGFFAYFALSPDGRRIAFVTESETRELWVRDLDAGSARHLSSASTFSSPFWSPDGRSIAFFHQGKLRKIDPNGGQPVTLCDAPTPRGGTWGTRDTIVFAPSSTGPIMRVSAAGGNPTPVTRVDTSSESTHRWPTFLPDGRHFVFLARGSSAGGAALFVGDIDSHDRRPAAPGLSTSAYDPRGFLLFFRDAALRALPWDPSSAKATGDSIPVADDVEYQINNSMARFSLSQTGMLAWIAGASTGNMQLTWFDRDGKITGTLGPPGQMGVAGLSPDGRFVATDRIGAQGGEQDIWLYDLARGAESRFTFTSTRNQWPVWSPDGKFLAYFSAQNGKYAVAIKPAAGNGPEQILVESATTLVPSSWSRDGRYLVLATTGLGSSSDISILSDPLDPNRRKLTPWLQTPANETSAVLSPDGKWMAYMSDDSGAFQVYVSSFPAKDSKYQISTEGGLQPFWSANGKELFFLSAGRVLMQSTVTPGARFEFSPPKALFQTRVINSSVAAITPDGKRFLIPSILNATSDIPIHIVTNWRAGVKP